MKYSIFNTLLPYENGMFLLYNSLRHKVIFLQKELSDVLEHHVALGIDGLKTVHPDFYGYLSEQNFLVENNFDEIEDIRKITNQIDNDPFIFLLTVNPTMNCNFNCWYCYETHVKGSKLTQEKKDAIKKIMKRISDYEQLKLFSLSFFGGEPLLYFKNDVIPLIEYALEQQKGKRHELTLSFTTNGYLINEQFIDYFTIRNLHPHFQITFDGYRNEHNKVRYIGTKGSYDTIVANIKNLLAAGMHVRARINYTNNNIKQAFCIIDDFKELPQRTKDELLVFDFHRVWQTDTKGSDVNAANDCMKELSDVMRDKGFRTMVRYSPNNMYNSCYADKRNSVVINYNGDIFKCTARDFTTENRAGYLSSNGELIWDDGYMEKRMNSKLNNKRCLSCNILPLCNGGCSQHSLEHLNDGKNYCVYTNADIEINKIIKTKVEEILYAQA